MPLAQSVYVASIAIPTTLLLVRVLGRCLHSYFTQKMTVLYDIPHIGKSRSDNGRVKGAAVICGGSIAGLWTARVCADHFEEVIIVEPEGWLATEDGVADVFDEKGTQIIDRGLHPRTRVSQYRAQHVFQPLALICLRRLFPTFDNEIRRIDGRIEDANYNLQTFGRMITLPKVVYPDASFSKIFFITRQSFERILRRLVSGYSDRIHWFVGTATGVTADEKDPTVIKSVTIRTEAGNEETIQASLVVDCTGGTQAGHRWLRRIFSDPKQSTLLQRFDTAPRGVLAFEDLRIEYNTMQRYRKFRIYVPPETRSRLPIPGGYDNAGWIFTYMPRPGLEHQMFMIARMEGHRIEWAFVGWGDPPLPETLADVKDWLQNMETDASIPGWIFELTDALSGIKEECETELGRYPSCSWIRYERASYIPSNFVAIGDSVMRVNPAFGQGCSKAAIGAITLDSFLRKPSLIKSTAISAGFGREFFKCHSSRIAGTWDGTKPTDYQWDSTTPVKGEKLSDERFTGKVVSLVMQLAGRDEFVGSALWHVRTFLAPQTDLMHPRILAKMLSLYVRQQLGWV